MDIPFDVNDPAAREALFRRGLWAALALLRDDTAPRWGNMTAAQMVDHLAWGFEVSTGRSSVECGVPEARRERWKAFLYDDTPMPREFRNPALVGGLPPLRHGSLDDARAALRSEVDRFLDHGRDAPEATHVHPTFGPLGAEEWSRAHFKHVHHHLDQFGLLDGGTSRL
jgi:oxepin-CoA hydrolase/3-oxo-5,6-dehydrosuberyl-CoA semialdehyde dehydrogenase